MKLEMTDRDKKLLIGLAIGVIIVCFGYWGIFPIIMDMQDIDDDIMVQSDLEQLNSMKIAQLVGLEMDNQTYEEEILEARANFYKMMTSDQIDKEFTEKALEHNLLIYDMTITMPMAPAELLPYQYSRKALYGDEEDIEGDEVWGEASNDIVSSDDILFSDMEEENNTGVYCAAVSLMLSGSSNDLQDLMEELVKEGIKIRMCSFSYERSREVVAGGNNAYDVIYDNKLSVMLEIYMCEE